MQPDVGELALVDRGQRLGHAVDERLDADEAGARIALGFRDQVLAAAEAAFQPHVVDAVEQRAQIGGRGRRQIERKLRQQRVEQRGLARPQRMALAPAEEGAGSMLLVRGHHGCHRPRTCATIHNHRKTGCPAQAPGMTQCD